MTELSGQNDISNHTGDFRSFLISVSIYLEDFIQLDGDFFIFWLELFDEESESSCILASGLSYLYNFESDLNLLFWITSWLFWGKSKKVLMLSGSLCISGESIFSSSTISFKDFILLKLIELCFCLIFEDFFLIEYIRGVSSFGVEGCFKN